MVKKHVAFNPAIQKQLGSRLRSPLPRRETVPAQPFSRFFHHTAFAKLGNPTESDGKCVWTHLWVSYAAAEKSGIWMALKIFGERGHSQILLLSNKGFGDASEGGNIKWERPLSLKEEIEYSIFPRGWNFSYFLFLFSTAQDARLKIGFTKRKYQHQKKRLCPSSAWEASPLGGQKKRH